MRDHKSGGLQSSAANTGDFVPKQPAPRGSMSQGLQAVSLQKALSAVGADVSIENLPLMSPC